MKDPDGSLRLQPGQVDLIQKALLGAQDLLSELMVTLDEDDDDNDFGMAVAVNKLLWAVPLGDGVLNFDHRPGGRGAG